MKEPKDIFELEGLKLGQILKVKKQTEFEKLPLEDGTWIVSKLIHPYVASQDSNRETSPACLVVWADSSNWRELSECAKKITIADIDKMGDRVQKLNLA